MFDGKHFSKAALEFANHLNRAERILLTGLFLPSIDYTDAMMYYSGGWAWPLYIPSVDTDTIDMEENIERFKQFCIKNDIEHRVHDQINGSLKNGIRLESRYADLMLMNGESFYSNLGELTQQEYRDDVMLKAECPVIVLPEDDAMPQNLVIAYDGSYPSVFALKQFTYVLPGLCKLPATLVYASEKDNDIPDMAYIEELGSRHFEDLTFFKLEVDAKKYFNTWVTDRGKPIVIAGSFSTSRFFKKHFVDDIIKDHRLPVFIAHP